MVVMRVVLQFLSTASPPIRRGQQPDSRLMMCSSFGICGFVQPTLSAIGSIQLQSPCLYGVGSALAGVAANRIGIRISLMSVCILRLSLGQDRFDQLRRCACLVLPYTTWKRLGFQNVFA